MPTNFHEISQKNSENSCYHCGLDIPKNVNLSVKILGKDQQMCCYGCQAVAQSIVESGLENYYLQRDALPNSPRTATPDILQDLTLFNQENFQQSFVKKFDENQNQNQNQNLTDEEVTEKVFASLKNSTTPKKKSKNLVEKSKNVKESKDPKAKKSDAEIVKNDDEIAEKSNENKAENTNIKSPEKPTRTRNYDDSVNQRYIYYRDQKDIIVPKVLSLVEQLQNLVPTGRFKIQTEEVKRAKEAKKAERAARRAEKEEQALRAKSEKITAELDGRILPKAPPKVPKKREKKEKEKDKK